MNNIIKLTPSKEVLNQWKNKLCLVSINYDTEEISEDLEKFRSWAIITMVTKSSIHVIPYCQSKEFKRLTREYRGLSGKQIVNYYGDTEFPEYCRRLAEGECEMF